MNPNATVIMICGSSIGYCLGEMHGCALGLAITSGLICLLSAIFSR